MRNAEYRIGQAAGLLGVSDDTVRRWADAGRLPTRTDQAGVLVVDGTDLAALSQELAGERPDQGGRSARNTFPGIVTRVVRGDVMSQVEVQAGPHRLTSLISTEAVDELGLAPGVSATATVKATNVGVQLS